MKTNLDGQKKLSTSLRCSLPPSLLLLTIFQHLLMIPLFSLFISSQYASWLYQCMPLNMERWGRKTRRKNGGSRQRYNKCDMFYSLSPQLCFHCSFTSDPQRTTTWPGYFTGNTKLTFWGINFIFRSCTEWTERYRNERSVTGPPTVRAQPGSLTLLLCLFYFCFVVSLLVILSVLWLSLSLSSSTCPPDTFVLCFTLFVYLAVCVCRLFFPVCRLTSGMFACTRWPA